MRCITFAAPPVISSGPRNCQPGFLSFINEGDPVPRMDKSYALSIVELYRLCRTSVLNGLTEGDQWAPPPAQLHIPPESLIITLHVMNEDDRGFEMRLCHYPGSIFERTLALDFERHRMCWYLKEIDEWIKRSGDTR